MHSLKLPKKTTGKAPHVVSSGSTPPQAANKPGCRSDRRETKLMPTIRGTGGCGTTCTHSSRARTRRPAPPPPLLCTAPRNGVTVSSHTRDVPGRWAVTLRMSPVTTIFIRRAPPPRRISPQRHGNEAARCATNGSWNVETLLSLRSSPKQKMSTPATSSWDGPVAYHSANTCMWPALGCKRAAAETMLMQSGLALMQQRLHGDHALAGCMGASCWRAFRPLSTPARTSWLCSGENHPRNSHLPGVRDLLNLTQLRVQVRHAGRELGSWITRGYTRGYTIRRPHMPGHAAPAYGHPAFADQPLRRFHGQTVV